MGKKVYIINPFQNSEKSTTEYFEQYYNLLLSNIYNYLTYKKWFIKV